MPRPVHFEIHADVMERAADFYRNVFGWKLQPFDNSLEYYMVNTGPQEEPGINGGMIKRKGLAPEEAQPTNAFVCTIQVDDIEKTIVLVEQHGGRIVVPKYAMPKFAWLCYCKDTEGNIFGLYQADSKAK